MAPLKFRAWDKNGKTMVVGERENFDDMIAWRFGHWDPLTDDPNDKELSGVALMQWTGLTAKNGKEIFEGDLVSVSGKETIIGQVIWAPMHAAFIIWAGIGEKWIRLGDVRLADAAVFGNAYENPPLVR